MVSIAIRQLGQRTLASMPWAWKLLRHYVRYSPRGFIPHGINERVNAFYGSQRRPFVARTTFGRYVAGDTGDIIQRYIFLYGRWEPNLTRWISRSLKHGDVAVDVGANIGYFSLLASSLVGNEGKVISIEASPTIFEKLRNNVSLNRVENIRLVNRAASDAPGTLRLFRAPAHNLGATSTYADAGFEDEGAVEAQSLHALLTTEEIARTRLIKIDVEGAEISVVKGLLRVLSMARKDLEIVIEVGGGPKGSPRAEESAAVIVPLFAEHGFNVYRLRNDYAPAAYVRTHYASPQRVRDAKSIREECDLVFSRRDAEAL